MEDDLHNPFGDEPRPREPDVFDPEPRRDERDPFWTPDVYEPDDEEPPSTRDV